MILIGTTDITNGSKILAELKGEAPLKLPIVHAEAEGNSSLL